ncbi:MAG: hypothetical protein MI919_10975 [Holophagales bacterium]|nr:hypothetical protein [Holophagales bacterium]
MKALFHPTHPEKEQYSAIAIFGHLGYTATLDPEADFDFAFAWSDTTWVEPLPVLEEIARSRPVVNLRCRDISKRRVETEFRRVFGYGSFVDPLSHRGTCARKYDENALGGSLIQCPIDQVEEGFVYQKHIDSTRDGFTLEFRVPVIFGTLPLVYLARKITPTGNLRAGKDSIRAVETAEVFERHEVDRILRFCAGMGLDFGELDVMRANDDGRLYVLDANKTPTGMGILNRNKWRPSERREVIRCLSEAFDGAIRRRLDSGASRSAAETGPGS